MKSCPLLLWTGLALVALLPTVSLSQQPAVRARASLTLTLLMYKMDKQTADQLLIGQQSGSGVSELHGKVTALVSSKKATLTSLTSVSTRSGQRTVGKSAQASLTVDPVIGPDGVRVSMAGTVTAGTQKLTLPVTTLSMSDTAMVGRLDDPATGDSEVAFLRVQSQ
jgi:hypothetical protein